MAKKEGEWAFPVEMRPRAEEWRFDLERALDSVVGLRAEVPEDAFTAQILGTLRAGSGVVIREDGLVLTIGYLITEASTIWVTTNKGTVVGGFPLAYDQTTGFGLVHPLGKLGVRPIERGSATSVRVGENVVMAGHRGAARPAAPPAAALARPVCDRSGRAPRGRRPRARRSGRESRRKSRRRGARSRRRQAGEPRRSLPARLGLRQRRRARAVEALAR